MAPSSDDFVRVASCETPTEAHLLRGVLQAAGLDPFVADANTVQAQPWMTQAVGGVRVLVPGGQADAARQAMADYEAGRLQLEDDGGSTAPVPPPPLPAAVYSPDKAVLWSFLLTPVFGAAIQVANDARLPASLRRRGRWAWLLLLMATTLAALVLGFQAYRGPLFMLRTSLAVSFLTVVWYFAAGSEQSKQLIAGFGPRYRRRSVALPALAVAALEVLAGLALHELL